jgi:hypothetical protein
MERDDYPVSIHDGPTIDVSDEQAAAYEQTLLLLLSDWIGGGAHGHSGVLLDVSLAGRKPDTKLVLRYRSHAGGEYDAEEPIWHEERLSVPAVGDDPPSYDAPAEFIGALISNWLDGSVHADDDPDWIERERRRAARSHGREGPQASS